MHPQFEKKYLGTLFDFAGKRCYGGARTVWMSPPAKPSTLQADVDSSPPTATAAYTRTSKSKSSQRNTYFYYRVEDSESNNCRHTCILAFGSSVYFRFEFSLFCPEQMHVEPCRMSPLSLPVLLLRGMLSALVCPYAALPVSVSAGPESCSASDCSK